MVTETPLSKAATVHHLFGNSCLLKKVNYFYFTSLLLVAKSTSFKLQSMYLPLSGNEVLYINGFSEQQKFTLLYIYTS